MPTKRDHYDVLGLKRHATESDIKAAYRKLARQFHPDVNKAADAAQKFAEVQDAYDTLSDAPKRKLYDQFGHAGVEGSRAAGNGGGPGAGGARRPHGTYTWSNIAGEPFQGEGISDSDLGSIFEEIFGAGSARPSSAGGSPFGSHARARSRASKGRDIDAEITIGFLDAVRGGTHTLRIQRGGSAQSIEVTIPAGITDGTKLRVRGSGSPSAGGSGAGDLILAVRVGAHPLFRREGEKQLDLALDLPLTIAEAALGTTITVPTPTKAVELTIPPGSSSGQRLRVRGLGIKTSAGDTGDLYAVLRIVAPKELSPEDHAALTAMRSRLPNPRSGTEWSV